MVVLMEVTEVRKAAGAGAAVEADLEAAVVADTIEVLTEAAEVVQEEEEAWEWAIVEDSISLVDQENQDMEDPASCRTRITLITTPSLCKAWETTTLSNQWLTFLSRLGSLR